MAHQAALEAGGTAVAVLASGLDQITPAANHWLGQKILKQGGALISEYPPGAPVHKYNFVARNRLVAGLSQAVLITEAAAKSGSLHTVNFALDQGKTVMAVPGNINSSLSAGTNQLIKTGALPVTELADILLALGLTPTPQQLSLPTGNPAEIAILELLQTGITDGGELLKQSKLKPQTFNQTLTMLEITGHIYALGAGRWGLR